MMASGVEGWQLRVYHVITRLNLEPQMTNNRQEMRGWYTCTRQPGRSPMMTFFGLAHMVDATQLLGWGGVGWGRDDDIL